MDYCIICDCDIFISNFFVCIFSFCFDCDIVIFYVNMVIINMYIFVGFWIDFVCIW